MSPVDQLALEKLPAGLPLRGRQRRRAGSAWRRSAKRCASSARCTGASLKKRARRFTWPWARKSFGTRSPKPHRTSPPTSQKLWIQLRTTSQSGSRSKSQPGRVWPCHRQPKRLNLTRRRMRQKLMMRPPRLTIWTTSWQSCERRSATPNWPQPGKLQRPRQQSGRLLAASRLRKRRMFPSSKLQLWLQRGVGLAVDSSINTGRRHTGQGSPPFHPGRRVGKARTARARMARGRREKAGAGVLSAASYPWMRLPVCTAPLDCRTSSLDS
mmetsp:Transcript_78457/g.188109  ORF Transcript_78457/g.188109 Transcript_78457/m.188109 type:complete len:269 (-) Transcript_78457:225-1031(-)